MPNIFVVFKKDINFIDEEFDGVAVQSYNFDTQKELEAFQLGAEVMYSSLCEDYRVCQSQQAVDKVEAEFRQDLKEAFDEMKAQVG